MENIPSDVLGTISNHLDDRDFRAFHCVSKPIFQACYRLPRWQSMLKARLGEAAYDHYPAKDARAMYFYAAWLNKPSSNCLTLGISNDCKLIIRDMALTGQSLFFRIKRYFFRYRPLLRPPIQDIIPIERLINVASYRAWDYALQNNLYPTTHLNQTLVVSSMNITRRQTLFNKTITPKVIVHRMNSAVYVRLLDADKRQIGLFHILPKFKVSKLRVLRTSKGEIFTSHPRGKFCSWFSITEIPFLLKMIRSSFRDLLNNLEEALEKGWNRSFLNGFPVGPRSFGNLTISYTVEYTVGPDNGRLILSEAPTSSFH